MTPPPTTTKRDFFVVTTSHSSRLLLFPTKRENLDKTSSLLESSSLFILVMSYFMNSETTMNERLAPVTGDDAVGAGSTVRNVSLREPDGEVRGGGGTIIPPPPLSPLPPPHQQETPYFHSAMFLELLCCIGLSIIGLILEFVGIQPRKRDLPYIQLESTGEYIVNQMFNETFVCETVSTPMLVVYSLLIPILFCFWLAKWNSATREELNRIYCAWFTAFGLNLICTDVIKLYVGYLRPIFYDQCQIADEDFEICTTDNNDNRLSFPSGHASLSMCGLLLFSKFLHQRVTQRNVYKLDVITGQVYLQQNPTVITSSFVGLHRLISLLCYFPVMAALFIGASRVVDNKHFPADVVGGAVLGGSIAQLVFGIWFPSWPTSVHPTL